MTSEFPKRLCRFPELSFEINANGSVHRIDYRDLFVNVFPGTEVEGGPTALYLRVHGSPVSGMPLLGPQSDSRLHHSEHGAWWTGRALGIEYRVELCLDAERAAWFWRIEARNESKNTLEIDAVWAQDIALAHYGATRHNEYYVSQYVDFTPLEDVHHGTVLAVRQNLPMGGRNPWALLGCRGGTGGYTTDGLGFYGMALRESRMPAGLLDRNLRAGRVQHEHSMAVLQSRPVALAPGEKSSWCFFAVLENDHPSASGTDDLARLRDIDAAIDGSPSLPPDGDGMETARTIFLTADRFASRDLSDEEILRDFPGERRLVEFDGERLLSFFRDEARHVVLAAKERMVLRPHGHILRSGSDLVPDERSLTSTAWMAGVFHSQVTEGHVNINRFLSTVHGYLGWSRVAGIRLFVEGANGFEILELPSAFEMGLRECRWIYRDQSRHLEITATAGGRDHELQLAVKVHSPEPLRFLAVLHVAINGDDGLSRQKLSWQHDGQRIFVSTTENSDLGRRFPKGGFSIHLGEGFDAETVSDDRAIYADGVGRDQPLITIGTPTIRQASLRITGDLLSSLTETAAGASAESAAAAEVFDHRLRISGGRGVAEIAEIVPWFAHNALIHYLAPRGLEQYSGGGWGTRDVCQGPVELLLAAGEWAAVRDLLLRVFRNQNPSGDWPQWFMFFDRERNIRPGDCHGDIVYWPLLALGEYLAASEDASILDEDVVYFHPSGDAYAERESVQGHVRRALDEIRRGLAAGTALPIFGNGDWNDALQPVDFALAQRLTSGWTAALFVQALRCLANALRKVGSPSLRWEADALADSAAGDLERYLVRDGLTAGYGFFRKDGGIDPLFHPRDDESGIRFGLLPLTQAILADAVSPEEARMHASAIREHLVGVDGARLFDRPVGYHGGPMSRFQRAESSSYFGREMGVMYMHANLRYAEALARLGDSEGFFSALQRGNPIGLRELVPATAWRQLNCYYSSSDARCADRYEGARRYDDILAGRVPLEGGWRIYSSGAGIAYRLIRECLLGIRLQRSTITFDPAVPKVLDGMTAELPFGGVEAMVEYRTASSGCGVEAITLDGEAVPFTRGYNPYRTGPAIVDRTSLEERLRAGSRLRIELA